MPTAPYKKLLDRDLRQVESKQEIKACCRILVEIVNYGTNVLPRCQSSPTNPFAQSIPGDGHIAIFILYRNILGFIDSIQVQISQSVVEPADLCLRSAFETFLQLEWILKEDTIRRSFSYLVIDICNRISKYRSLDSSSESVKAMQAKIRKDRWASEVSLPKISDLRQRIRNLERILTYKHYSEVHMEYKKHPKTKWYGLFDGPKNIEQLADKLGHPFWYEKLYRHWSETSHSAHQLIGNFREGGIRVLREGSEIFDTTSFAKDIGVRAHEVMLEFYRPQELEKFWAWYRDEIRPQTSYLQ